MQSSFQICSCFVKTWKWWIHISTSLALSAVFIKEQSGPIICYREVKFKKSCETFVHFVWFLRYFEVISLSSKSELGKSSSNIMASCLQPMLCFHIKVTFSFTLQENIALVLWLHPGHWNFVNFASIYLLQTSNLVQGQNNEWKIKERHKIGHWCEDMT